jgi:hemerythrin-like metal-binding protein
MALAGADLDGASYRGARVGGAAQRRVGPIRPTVWTETGMGIAWQPNMETGAPLLDAQHRALVERAAALVTALEAGSERTVVERALRGFGDYSVRHFSMDEDCSMRGSCPALQWNGIARSELIKIMAGFRESFERGATPELAENLSCKLSEWVARYIPGPESMIRPCVTTPR